MGPTPKRNDRGDSTIALEMELASKCRNIYGAIGGAGGVLFYALNVIRRSDGDWLAMCKVTELGSMEKKIAFGAGKNYFDALSSLNTTIGVGGWRVDKPYRPRG